MNAYSFHHHLVPRPDDIWLAILTQWSSYINAHAEELRGSFVAHTGKEKLVVRYSNHATRFDVDWTDFTHKIGLLIEENVVDPELRRWILPAFSTTTDQDVTVANIVMMASLQSYFEYVCELICGLPSVTLLGTKEDYELILRRLKKLHSYGPEPTQFAALLRPIIKRFILSFDPPASEDVLDFWNHIFSSYSMGSGPTYYSGWITAFMFWDGKGKPLGDKFASSRDDRKLPPLVLDGVAYPRVESGDAPPGHCTVPVTIEEYGGVYEAEMLAGSVGWDALSSGMEMAEGGVGLDSVRPRSEWFIYHRGSYKSRP